jgi:hypothetical protein
MPPRSCSTTLQIGSSITLRDDSKAIGKFTLANCKIRRHGFVARQTSRRQRREFNVSDAPDRQPPNENPERQEAQRCAGNYRKAENHRTTPRCVETDGTDI